MAISFNDISSTLRVPFAAVEIDNSRAQQGPALLAYTALLVGQKIASGSATADTIHRVSSADAVALLAGRGSMLHRMALAWFNDNRATECWVGIVADDAAGVAGSGTLTFTGTAAEDGTIHLYAGGEYVPVAVTSGDSASTIASNVCLALGKRASQTVTLSSAEAGDNLTISGTTPEGVAISVTFVGTAGAVTLGAATYSIDTGNPEAATSLSAQINAHPQASRLVEASVSSAIVTVTSLAPGGNAIALATTDAVDLAVGGPLLTGGSSAPTDLPIYATVSSGIVTVKFRHKGAVGNEYDLRINYQDGEQLPAGVTLAFSPEGLAGSHTGKLQSGATNPGLDNLIAALTDSWFQIIVHPYTDATSLGDLETEMASRFGSMRMIDGMLITASAISYSLTSTLGDSRNSPHSCIVSARMSPTSPWEYAANVGAVVAKAAAADPARPFQTLALPWVKAPAEVDRMTLEERNLLLYDGISTTKVVAGGVVQIERLITTYQRNAADSADTSYLDVTTMLTLLYLRYSFRSRILSRYPRHKLANDGTRVGAGQAIITPSIGRAEAILWFRDMERLGLVEGFTQFKSDLVVERNESDPNRLDFLLPTDLINFLAVTAVKLQFLL